MVSLTNVINCDSNGYELFFSIVRLLCVISFVCFLVYVCVRKVFVFNRMYNGERFNDHLHSKIHRERDIHC